SVSRVGENGQGRHQGAHLHGGEEPLFGLDEEPGLACVIKGGVTVQSVVLSQEQLLAFFGGEEMGPRHGKKGGGDGGWLPLHFAEQAAVPVVEFALARDEIAQGSAGIEE